MELSELALRFATALHAADAKRPFHTTRTGRQYQPGIGPHPENVTMRLVLDEFSAEPTAPRSGQFIPYPKSPRSKCDLWIGTGPEWVIEVKMARLDGDNGKPDDTAVGQILSPYASDHSALSDCAKLAGADFTARTAVMIYGFQSKQRRVEILIDSFELLASAAVALADRHTAAFGPASASRSPPWHRVALGSAPARQEQGGTRGKVHRRGRASV